MTPTVLLRSYRAAALESSGVTGAALECLLRETAGERHSSRTIYARWAAEEYYLRATALDRDAVTCDTLALGAGAILWADVVGVGGRDGVEGLATSRHPAFAGCGKGRKQATDGGAWSAAIHSAALDCGGWFRISNEVLIYSLDSRGETVVDETTIPREWVRSILREGLRRAVTGLGWHPFVPFDAPPTSVAAWAACYNEMTSTEQVA